MIIKGDENVIYPNHLHFGKYVLENLRAVNGDDVCFEIGETHEKLTYREFVQYSVNLSLALSKLEVKRGDVVAIGSDNFINLIPTVVAVVLSGAAFTGHEQTIGKAVLKHRLDLVKPKYFICSLPFWETYKDLLLSLDYIKTYIGVDDIPGLQLSLRALTSVNEDVDKFEPADVQGMTDTALIFYTSGTTGMPKAAEITHFNSIVTSSPLAFAKKTTLKTLFIKGSWTYNSYSFITFKFILLGRRIVFSTTNTIETALPILRDCKVNMTLSSPIYIRRISESIRPTDDYFDTVEMIYTRSFPLRAETITHLRKCFPKVKDIIQGYGLVEGGEPMSEIWTKYKPGSVGVLSPGLMVKVVDPKTRAVLGPHQHGEICIKGATVMKGYLNNQRTDYFDSDGFYKTGDLGYYDDEKYFFIVDRLTDIIAYGGAKISPVQLENVLLQHPAVLDAGVIGRANPLLGAEPMAFVVKKPKHDVSEEELIKFVTSEDFQARLYISIIEIRSFIKPTIDWLLNQRFPSGNFPSSMGSGSGDRLVQWCHGAPGLDPCVPFNGQVTQH